MLRKDILAPVIPGLWGLHRRKKEKEKEKEEMDWDEVGGREYDY